MIENTCKHLQTLANHCIFDDMSTVAKNFRIDSELNAQATTLLDSAWMRTTKV